MSNYATRRAEAHSRIREKFGQNADGEQLYCWHSGAEITCYEENYRTGRALAMAVLLPEGTVTIYATKAEFTAVPKAGDSIQVGVTQATAQTLRVDSVATTHIWPNYRLELIDPNKAVTAS